MEREIGWREKKASYRTELGADEDERSGVMRKRRARKVDLVRVRATVCKLPSRRLCGVAKRRRARIVQRAVEMQKEAVKEIKTYTLDNPSALAWEQHLAPTLTRRRRCPCV
jgi:hypothetical protein